MRIEHTDAAAAIVPSVKKVTVGNVALTKIERTEC
jgi:hypothetical protein